MFQHYSKVQTSFVLLLIATIISGVLASPCLQVLGSFGIKTFYTGNKDLNWFESLEYCHSLGMSLASLENEDEADMVSLYLLKCSQKNHVWISATDLFKEGTFRWMLTGKQVNRSSPKWLQGQPDGGVAQNCLLINGITGKYEDQFCRFQYSRPLCQNLP